jgi:hypothetical protein
MSRKGTVPNVADRTVPGNLFYTDIAQAFGSDDTQKFMQFERGWSINLVFHATPCWLVYVGGKQAGSRWNSNKGSCKERVRKRYLPALDFSSSSY